MTGALRRSRVEGANSRISLIFFFLWCATSCYIGHARGPEGQAAQSDSIQRHWDHLLYLVALKNDIARASWPDFARLDFPSPALYYTVDGTYVINPNPHILALAKPVPVDSPKEGWKVYKLPEAYTDTVNFQFANSYGDDPGELYYKENVIIFSSFDLTRRFIPDISDLQDWAIMVHHELFHAYQRSAPNYKTHFQNLSIPGGPDSYLGTYHRDLGWFRESVHRENEILKEVWQDKRPVSQGILEYMDLQAKRRARVLEEYGVAIGEVEDYEITFEGHARYFESLAKRYLSGHVSDTSMLSDSERERIRGHFKGYQPERDTGLPDIYNDRYYYQLGYNLSMILEKHLPAYAITIYKSAFDFNTYLRKLAEGGTSQD